MYIPMFKNCLVLIFTFVLRLKKKFIIFIDEFCQLVYAALDQSLGMTCIVYPPISRIPVDYVTTVASNISTAVVILQ